MDVKFIVLLSDVGCIYVIVVLLGILYNGSELNADHCDKNMFVFAVDIMCLFGSESCKIFSNGSRYEN